MKMYLRINSLSPVSKISKFLPVYANMATLIQTRWIVVTQETACLFHSV